MSENERYKIRKRYSTLSLVLLGVILAYILISAFVFKKITILYNVVIIVGLGLFWVIMDIITPIKAHDFDGKTPEQMAAYKKFAAADLLSYAGLMYFALAMTSNTGIYGAIIYLIGRVMKNRFKEEFEGTAESEDEDEVVAEVEPETEDSQEALLTDGDGTDSIAEEEEIPAVQDPADDGETSEEQHGSV
ncbi:MAG: hypothetical protein J6S83_07900 [Lachnospiraceae bacterium]|nr:hypothetical protein [Lachnospiraceae bacterium]